MIQHISAIALSARGRDPGGGSHIGASSPRGDRAAIRPGVGRQGPRSDEDQRANPDRPAWIATPSFRARRVGLLRPEGPATSELPARVDVHLVEVRERNPPTGQEPVRWVLVTSLPTGSVEEILRVVDAYRKRWVIERTW